MNKVSILVFIGIIGLLSACTPKPDPIVAPTVPVAPADQAEAVKSGNAFALDLYRALAAGNDNNIFFSPLSISTNLAMAAAGARGQTEAELSRALHFTLPADRIHPALGNLLYDLRDRGAGRDYLLLVANRVWVRNDLRLAPDYEMQLKKCYGADVGRFVNDAGAAVAVNDWTRRQTRGECEKILDEEPATALVLANAVYFHAKWEVPFNSSKTRDMPFHVAPGRDVSVPMMLSDSADFGIIETEAFLALKMPYRGDRLTMVIVLPTEGQDLASVEKRLEPGTLVELTQPRRDYMTEIMVPKFSLLAGLRLKPVLSGLGARDAFIERADFTGMLQDGRGVYLAEVYHRARLEVDETGTRAWAATASPPAESIPFMVDSPFLFLIGDTKTGAIIFMGRVMDPTKSQ